MIKIKINKFEGPLDLLLQLIKKEKIDITEVSLARVADQYLSSIKELERVNPEELADFLVIAAKLIYLKTKALLPHLQDEEEEEDDLVERLKIYKEYLEASKKIRRVLEHQCYLFSSSRKGHLEKVFSPPPLELSLLPQVFLSFINRKKKEQAYLRQEKIIRRLSLKEKVKEIEGFLLKKKKFILSSSLSKEEKIVSFLAILEIARQKKIFIFQKDFFSEVVVTVR